MISIELLPGGSLLGIELLKHLQPHLISQELFILQLFVHHRVFGVIQVSDIYVDCEKSHWLDTSLHGDGVNLSAALLHFI